jgi:hypothetical protein
LVNGIGIKNQVEWDKQNLQMVKHAETARDISFRKTEA